MRHKIVIVCVLILAAAVLLAYLARSEGGFETTLPGGTHVELVGTSIGTAAFTTDKPWHTVARRWLPQSLHVWLPPSFRATCSGATNGITVFLRVTKASTNRAPSLPWRMYATKDEAGFRYPSDGGYCTFGGGPGNKIYGLTLSAYPRRQDAFRFLFLGQGDEVLGRLWVPNPRRGPFLDWQPQPLPQTLTDGPVTLTLRSLKERGEGARRHLRPEWNLAAGDPLWEQARISLRHLRDATGNEASMLSPQEPAWKVVAKVERQRPEEFTSEEKIEIVHLPVPAEGNFVDWDRSYTRGDVVVTVHGVGGAGRLMVTNGVARAMLPPQRRGGGHSTRSGNGETVETWDSELPFVWFEARNLGADDSLEMFATDDDGAPIKLKDHNTYRGSPGGGPRVYMVKFDEKTELTHVTFEILINRPLLFEFPVDPDDVERSEAP